MKVSWLERIWVNSPIRLFVQRQETRYFKKARPMSPGSHCLEIGCGRGAAISLIQRAFFPSRVDASDIDPAMVRLAARRSDRGERMRILHMVADAERLPYPDGCIDAVFNYGIIHHLEDWALGLREIGRVLKPGGGFYFEEIYPDLYANFLFRHLVVHPTRNRFYKTEYHAGLKQAGLDLLPGYRESRFGILGVAVKAKR